MHKSITVLVFYFLSVMLVLSIGDMVIPVQPEYKNKFTLLLGFVFVFGATVSSIGQAIRKHIESQED